MRNYTEYSVEVRLTSTNEFVRQVDIFDTYEQAESFVKTVADKLPEDQEYTIMGIDYEDERETCYYEA